MHYKINQEIIVKSENAAKSYAQPNKYVLDLIRNLANVNMVLDYGCGKLRYTIPLCKLSKKVIAIDSVEQITRKQKICGEKISIIEYSNEIKNLQAYSIGETEWKKYKYDFILCSNVLSAIPFDSERIEVLKNIKYLLSDEGKALITTQYRNSYFSAYKTRNNAIKFNDGWIIKNTSYNSFYGLINVESLVRYCNNVGLNISSCVVHEGSAFIVVT